MIAIISNEIDPAAATADAAGFLQRGQRPIEGLVRQPDLRGNVLERAIELDRPTARCSRQQQHLPDPPARTADAAQLDPEPQVLDYALGPPSGAPPRPAAAQ